MALSPKLSALLATTSVGGASARFLLEDNKFLGLPVYVFENANCHRTQAASPRTRDITDSIGSISR
jgi:hypothetical protein